MTTTTRRRYGALAAVVLPTLTVAALSVPVDAAERTNVVVILADDLGWGDLSAHGNTVQKTPNIDRLASQGMRFTQAYAAAPICGPTRVSLMTGIRPARVGATNWGGCTIPPAMTTLPEALQAGGYQTWIVGKWHLGDQKSGTPEENGFNLNIAASFVSKPVSYLSPYKMRKLEDGPAGEYLTDRLTDEAIQQLRKAGDKPFFLYLAHYAVHIPFTAPPDENLGPYRAAYRGKDKNLPVYAGMVANLDKNVGRVLDALDQLRLADSTTVIFTSDNGGYFPEACAPFRGVKGSCWEGGIRVPLIVRWPGTTPAGAVSEQTAISADLYPTVLRMAGLPLRPDQHRDGMDLSEALRGRAKPVDRELVWHFPHGHKNGGEGANASAIRSGSMKLVRYHRTGRDELYDLAKDPGETTDLTAANPAMAKTLADRLTAALAGMAQDADDMKKGRRSDKP